MKIDLSNPPKYLRQTTTGRIYAYSEFKAKRGDMEPYEMPAAKQDVTTPMPMTEEQKATIDAMINEIDTRKTDDSGPGRLELIKAAVAQIPAEEYGKPTMGRPAIPKVAQVSELAGFKVTVEEIVAAVTVE